MGKAIWFYMLGEKKEGPVSHNDLQGMLDLGKIDAQTKVWSESINEWLPVSDIEHFNLATLDAAPPIIIENQVDYARETDSDTAKPRPWVRFWARMVDYSLFSLFLGLIIGSFDFVSHTLEPFYGMVSIFLWVFVETVLVATWGTTPGKWLLKTFVRDQDNHRLTFFDALNRSFSVWWIGVGAGLPIVSLITMIVASVKLSNTGTTSWDHRNKYRVFHDKVGILRTLIVIFYFLFLFWFFTSGQFQIITMRTYF